MDCKCGRHAQTDSEYCWFCDPSVPDSVKQDARARGGMRGVKFPPACEFEDLPALDTMNGLRQFYVMIIKSLWDRASNPAAARVLKELGDSLRDIYIVERLEARMALIESGKIELLESGGEWLEAQD